MHTVFFTVLCQRVNDIDLKNRILACRLLGRLHLADANVLLMSLDKQSKSEGDWCAAGAFVLALEDQFASVRLAAIDSITRLSLGSARFSAEARRLLVDAFNDEAEEVRLAAVQGLCSVCSAGERLQGDQVQPALGLLDDTSDAIRSGARSLLLVCRVDDEEMLGRTVSCLHAVLLKYPQDLDEIMRTAAELAVQSAPEAQHCFLSLLRLTPFHANAEPRTDNLLYNLKMVMILNTAIGAEELPEWACRHHSYFRIRWPRLVPAVPLLQAPAQGPDAPSPSRLLGAVCRSLHAAHSEQRVVELKRMLRLCEDSMDRPGCSAAPLCQMLVYIVDRVLTAERRALLEEVSCLFSPVPEPVSAWLLHGTPWLQGGLEQLPRIERLTARVVEPTNRLCKGIAGFPLRIPVAASVLHARPDSALFAAVRLPDGTVQCAALRAGRACAAGEVYVYQPATEAPRAAAVQILVLRPGHRLPATADELARSGVPLCEPAALALHFKTIT